MMSSDVLVIGAGPTGMVLALELAMRGVGVRIVDRSEGPGTASRAMVVHARTLELYRRIGLAEEIVARGIKVGCFHLHDERGEVTRVPVGDFGKGLSPYPFVLSLPQDEHERLLEARLADAGVRIEWNTSLEGLVETGDRVRSTLVSGGREEVAEAAWLCGCDGAHSRVRELAGFEFPGAAYEQPFFVADVEATGAATDGDMHACFGTNLLCIVFPIRTSGHFRLIGLVPERLQRRENLRLEDVLPYVEDLVGIHVTDEHWFSTYRVHHRVATHFVKGRVIVAGDAGHVHSPAGGQGMNTGIGDAINLAWKLAMAASARASSRLVETYEPERIAFARTLVETTDRAFTGVVGRGMLGRFVRSFLIPAVVPQLFRLGAFRRLAFRVLSQIRIEYRDSPLAEGSAGSVCGGDRLPWVASADNFAALRTLDWQIHVYGAASPELVARAGRAGIRINAFPWSRDAAGAGLAEGALYLVRPDGYVALASTEQSFDRVLSFLDRYRIQP